MIPEMRLRIYQRGPVLQEVFAFSSHRRTPRAKVAKRKPLSWAPATNQSPVRLSFPHNLLGLSLLDATVLGCFTLDHLVN